MSLIVDQSRSPLVEQMVGKELFTTSPMVVVDVGASGGIAQHWRLFGSQLRAFGFEPLLKECERLNREAPSNVQYFPVFVTGPEGGALKGDGGSGPPTRDWNYFRSSAVRAQQLLGVDYVRDVFNSGEAVEYSKDSVTLDAFFEGYSDAVNFLKIDTDGHDFDVLRGATRLLDQAGALAVLIETQFQGDLHSDRANVFANIDRFLRAHGFVVFDLSAWRYSRAALPSRFVYEIPAQTERGPVAWGDALYFRDYGHPEYERLTGKVPAVEDLLKLACLFEMFEFDDCVVELLVKYRDRMASVIDVEQALDTVTPRVNGQAMRYRDFIRVFEENVRAFYPGSQLRLGDQEPEGGKAATGVDVSAIRGEMARLQAALTAVYQSRSWRWTRPLRGCVRGLRRLIGR